MMRMTLGERVTEQMDRWEKKGYTIQISDDKKEITFKPKDGASCWIYMAHGYTLTCGDYGEFAFDRQYSLEHPQTPEYMGDHCRSKNSDEFSYDKLQDDIVRMKEQIQGEAVVSDEFLNQLESILQDYSGNPGELDNATEEFKNLVDDAFGYTDEEKKEAEFIDSFDFKEGWYDTLGFDWNPWLIAQLAIMKLAAREAQK